MGAWEQLGQENAVEASKLYLVVHVQRINQMKNPIREIYRQQMRPVEFSLFTKTALIQNFGSLIGAGHTKSRLGRFVGSCNDATIEKFVMLCKTSKYGLQREDFSCTVRDSKLTFGVIQSKVI